MNGLLLKVVNHFSILEVFDSWALRIDKKDDAVELHKESFLKSDKIQDSNTILMDSIILAISITTVHLLS